MSAKARFDKMRTKAGLLTTFDSIELLIVLSQRPGLLFLLGVAEAITCVDDTLWWLAEQISAFSLLSAEKV